MASPEQWIFGEELIKGLEVHQTPIMLIAVFMVLGRVSVQDRGSSDAPLVTRRIRSCTNARNRIFFCRA